MPLYVYTALSESGALTKGEDAAATQEELTQALAGHGLLVQSIRRKRLGLHGFRRDRVRPENFLLFNQEFMALARAGLTIPEALALAANRPDHPALGGILSAVLEKVRGGALFSEACGHYPDVFEALYISALKTGEKTGDLANVLVRYQDYLKHRVALRRKVSHALAYPIFLLVALAVILGVLFAFVMPRFVAMYADFGANLPWPTQLLLDFVKNLPWILPLLAIVGTGAWFSWRSFTSTEPGRLTADRWKERLPLFGSVQRTLATAQLARALSTLLAGGTPLVEAMRTVTESIGNRAYAQRFKQATERVTEGTSLAHAIKQAQLVPDTAIKMIEVGEASGSLDRMLEEVAQFYEELLDSRLTRLMTLIEPVLMLLMGLLIGGIIIVMYLPIFSLADVIK